MIRFNQPLKNLKPWVDNIPQGLFDLEITNICFDSREVKSGDLFYVLPSVAGNEVDYINKAVSLGAVAIILNRTLSESIEIRFADSAIAIMAVDDVMETAGNLLSHCLYGQQLPMSVVGITGTNGKSSISFYLAQLLTELKHKCAVMGTVGYGHWDHLKPTGMTTLPLEQLHHALLDMSSEFKAVAVEVSSHGLAQNRLAGVKFEGAVFSNLSRDHLDYHGTMEAYGEAKALLFKRPELKFAVINNDDAYSRQLLKASSVLPITYGQSEVSDLRFKLEQLHDQGMNVSFRWQEFTHSIELPLFGQFNAENVAAAVLTCVQMGFEFGDVVRACHALKSVPGRMQPVNVTANQPLVIVDYAHTPDALQQVLMAVKQHTHKGKISLVVGCGGDRDTGKRPLMGKIALQFADNSLITSDNPRSEDPMSICQQMVSGLTGNFKIEVDRRLAIQQAIQQSDAGDIVIIAGKGHEDYQEIKGERRYFSDVEEAKNALQSENKA